MLLKKSYRLAAACLHGCQFIGFGSNKFKYSNQFWCPNFYGISRLLSLYFAPWVYACGPPIPETGLFQRQSPGISLFPE